VSYDGGNWNLDNTSYGGALLQLGDAALGMYFAAAGANPRTLTEIMRILANGRVLIGTTTDDGVNLLQVNGVVRASVLRITDGVGTPTTISGVAVVYVDSGDGDLKVKFGDGTVKTIVTDS
jgi:hypothetical protein